MTELNGSGVASRTVPVRTGDQSAWTGIVVSAEGLTVTTRLTHATGSNDLLVEIDTGAEGTPDATLRVSNRPTSTTSSAGIDAIRFVGGPLWTLDGILALTAATVRPGQPEDPFTARGYRAIAPNGNHLWQNESPGTRHSPGGVSPCNP